MSHGGFQVENWRRPVRAEFLRHADMRRESSVTDVSLLFCAVCLDLEACGGKSRERKWSHSRLAPAPRFHDYPDFGRATLIIIWV